MWNIIWENLTNWKSRIKANKNKLLENISRLELIENLFNFLSIDINDDLTFRNENNEPNMFFLTDRNIPEGIQNISLGNLISRYKDANGNIVNAGGLEYKLYDATIGSEKTYMVLNGNTEWNILPLSASEPPSEIMYNGSTCQFYDIALDKVYLKIKDFNGDITIKQITTV